MDADTWIAKDPAPGTAADSPAPDPSPGADAASEATPPGATTGAPGTEVAAGAEAAAAEAKAAGATDAQAAQAAQEYIEAQLDGKPFQLPKGVRIPWEQGGEQGFVSVDEARRNFLFQRDFTRKTQALAEERRRDRAAQDEWERQRVATEARFEALERERKAFLDAQLDPGARERLDRHLEAMATDPEYRRRWERGLEADAHDAVAAFDATQRVQAETQAIITDAQRYIDETAATYPGVDPLDVEAIYAEQWRRAAQLEDPRERQARTDQLRKPSFVDAIFKHEAQRIERVTAPLKGELDGLKKQLATLQAERRTDQHNTETAAAIARAKGPKVGVPAGAAPAPPGRQPPKPFAGGDAAAREQAKQAWVAGG